MPVTKTYYAEKMGIDPKEYRRLSALCLVLQRNLKSAVTDENAAGVPDVDIAITTRELGAHDQTCRYLIFTDLPDEEFDDAAWVSQPEQASSLAQPVVLWKLRFVLQ